MTAKQKTKFAKPNESYKNRLYFGDCLDVLKKLYDVNGEYIDLIYIDPPFNSKRDYNILFETIDLKGTQAQKEAFADTWSNVSYKDTLTEIQEIDLNLFRFLSALDSINISKSAIAYLTTMAIRIFYMHKVLKPSGSFYLHCDPTMSHYLKLVCDQIFGDKNFKNEISWKRSNPKSNNTNNFANCRDIILRYSKTDVCVFNKTFSAHDESYVKKAYKYTDKKGRYRLLPLLNPNDNRPNLTYEFLGITRVWRWTKSRMQKAYEDNLVVQLKPGAVPQYKLYLEDSKGKVITNDWNDIGQAAGHEYLGYPTQKPIELLERIVQTSSNEEDLVADFFCGCGTTIAAAQKLNRRWLGVDISHLAIGLVERKRLIEPYKDSKIKPIYEVDGFPKDLDSSRRLAEGTAGGRFKFQDWVIEAKLGGVHNPRRSADGGWDGHLTFDIGRNEKEIVLIEIKSGNVNVKNLREFCDVITKQKAAIGVFVCFAEQVTKPMLQRAKEEGYYKKDLFGNSYDKIQILTVEDLLNGGYINMPQSISGTVFKTAKKNISNGGDQKMLNLE